MCSGIMEFKEISQMIVWNWGVCGHIDFYCSGGMEQFLFIIIFFLATRMVHIFCI